MKKSLKSLFFLLLLYEMFFFFHQSFYEKLFDKYVNYFPHQEIKIDKGQITDHNLLTGLEEYEKGNYGKAIKFLKAFHVQDSTKESRFYLGVCHMEKGNYGIAATFFDSYHHNQKKEPEKISVWYDILCWISDHQHVRVFGKFFWMNQIEQLIKRGGDYGQKAQELKDEIESYNSQPFLIQVLSGLNERTLYKYFRCKKSLYSYEAANFLRDQRQDYLRKNSTIKPDSLWHLYPQ